VPVELFIISQTSIQALGRA